MDNNKPTILSVNAPSNKVSNKYRFISTGEFVRDVEAQGFELLKVQEPRKRGSLGKHMLTFKQSGAVEEVNGCYPRLIAVNSHDGSSAFKLMLGYYRLVCSNGLIIGTNVQSSRIVHLGYATEYVKQAVDAVVAEMPTAHVALEALSQAKPDGTQVIEFLQAARMLRETAQPVDLMELIRIRRDEDKAIDAFTVFNRVQETLINGLYHTAKTTERGIELHKARKITAVPETIRINRALWDLAEKHLLPNTLRKAA